MNCPRDNTELELVDERRDWETYRCVNCGLKITLEEGGEDGKD